MLIFTLICVAAAVSPSTARSTSSTQPASAPTAISTAAAETDAQRERLSRVAALRTGDTRSFQFQLDIDARAEQLLAFVSWSPPDRRCLILLDRFDHLPVLIAVDGRVWVYDLVGGQILLIRAEPELVMRMSGDKIQSQWGIRADFPNDASRLSLNVDPRGIFAGVLSAFPAALTFNPATRTIGAKHRLFNAQLELSEADPQIPVRFTLKLGNESPAVLTLSGVSRDQPLPSWHRPLDLDAITRHVKVIPVADAPLLEPQARDRLKTFQSLLASGGLFILRPACRDANLRARIEKNSPVKLNFEEIRDNEASLKPRWQAALRSAAFESPIPPAATTKPSPANAVGH